MELGFGANINFDIDEDGVKISVKKINVNDFVIDRVFKKIDKLTKIKRKKLDKKKDNDVVVENNPLIIDIQL